MYIPSTLIVSENAAATANNILASEMLFRAGIVSELVGAIVFIFLVGALYRLLNGVDKTNAWLMVSLVLLSVPITFLNVLNEIAALTLLHSANFVSVFDKRQVDALVMTFLDLHGSGVLLAQIFWGLWLFPLGVLVFRSGFLPRILGVLLIIACFGYVALPSYSGQLTEIRLTSLRCGLGLLGSCRLCYGS
jgi:F0F1-type ATP synthase assembly protein I